MISLTLKKLCPFSTSIFYLPRSQTNNKLGLKDSQVFTQIIGKDPDVPLAQADKKLIPKTSEVFAQVMVKDPDVPLAQADKKLSPKTSEVFAQVMVKNPDVLLAQADKALSPKTSAVFAQVMVKDLDLPLAQADKELSPKTSEVFAQVMVKDLDLPLAQADQELSLKTSEVFAQVMVKDQIGPFRPIYYDLETTGLLPNCHIVEIAAFDPIEKRSFSSFVNPQRPIPEAAIGIHRITDAMVADAPTFPEAARQFLTFCPPDTLLIAHNNDGFDRPVLEQEFRRAGMQFPPFRFFDTLKWARTQRPDLPGHSLCCLRDACGFPLHKAHRALEDVLMLQNVFLMLSKDIPLPKEFALIQKKAALNIMPFGKHRGKSLEDIPPTYVEWLASEGFFEREMNQGLKKRFIELGLLNPKKRMR